jgi:hypothetical protein
MFKCIFIQCCIYCIIYRFILRNSLSSCSNLLRRSISASSLISSCFTYELVPDLYVNWLAVILNEIKCGLDLDLLCLMICSSVIVLIIVHVVLFFNFLLILILLCLRQDCLDYLNKVADHVLIRLCHTFYRHFWCLLIALLLRYSCCCVCADRSQK